MAKKNEEEVEENPQGDEVFKKSIDRFYDLQEGTRAEARSDELDDIIDDIQNVRIKDYFINSNGAHAASDNKNPRPKSYTLKGKDKIGAVDNFLGDLIYVHSLEKHGAEYADAIVKDSTFIEKEVNSILGQGGYGALMQELKNHKGSVKKLLKNPNSYLNQFVQRMAQKEHAEYDELNRLQKDIDKRKTEPGNLDYAKSFYKSKLGDMYDVADHVPIENMLAHLTDFRSTGDKYISKEHGRRYAEDFRNDVFRKELDNIQEEYEKGNRGKTIQLDTRKDDKYHKKVA